MPENESPHISIRFALRLLAVIAVLALLLYGIFAEEHALQSRDDGVPPTTISGSEFIRGASVDRYQRLNDTLYDTRSQAVPESATLDDCPT